MDQSAEYLRLLVESAQDYAILAMDTARHITMWSSGAERMFGFSADEMAGQPADIIFVEEDRAAHAPAAEAGTAAAKGRAADERWHRRKNSERFYASGVMTPLRDRAGTLLGFVKIVRDLTERKLAQEALQASRDDLAHAVAERTRELQEANESLRAEIARRTAAETEREQSLRRIATAQEEERLRISREMHDEVGQDLAALMLRLNALEPIVCESNRKPVIAEAQQLTESIGAKLHALAIQLRPTALDDLGLAGAVSAYAELWSKHSNVPVQIHGVNLDPPRPPPELQLAVYRIIQEALTNVLKHAAATRVSIVLNRTPSELVAVVEDDGRGFPADELPAAAGDGLGLIGMRERVAAFRGRITIESQPGKGTTLIVRVPLSSS